MPIKLGIQHLILTEKRFHFENSNYKKDSNLFNLLVIPPNQLKESPEPAIFQKEKR